MALFGRAKELQPRRGPVPQLGVSYFVPSSGSTDDDVATGSVQFSTRSEILGRFQLLKSLNHRNLCEYLDILKGKHELLFVVAEHYPNSLENLYQSNEKGITMPTKCLDIETLRAWIASILDALCYLHTHGIVHHNLSPSTILITENEIKLTGHGLYYMTNGGRYVEFPIGNPRYLSPEAVFYADMYPTSERVDIWSLGVILIELFLGTSFWESEKLEDIIETLFKLSQPGPKLANAPSWDDVVENHTSINEQCLAFLKSELPPEGAYDHFHDFLITCLQLDDNKRPTAKELLTHPFLFKLEPNTSCWHLRPYLVSSSIDISEDEDLERDINELIKDPFQGLPLSQLYHLWKLAGGDVKLDLTKHGMLLSTPAIQRIPRSSHASDSDLPKEEVFSRAISLYTTKIAILSMNELYQRISQTSDSNVERLYWDMDYFLVVDSDDMNFLVEASRDALPSPPLNDDPFIFDSRAPVVNSTPTTPNGTIRLPLLMKEKDVAYQYHRISIFSELLRQYPASRSEIIHHAKADIPPLLRGKIWAAILGVMGDVEAAYAAIDKESETPNDRQIEVDVPRCHQYNELLCSPVGHEKLRRLLKCWVQANNRFVYWQGLDSLCAPFLTLNFNDEPLAFACLQLFIPRFLHNFFLVDNSPVIQEYLAVFRHLLSFHDPELSSHLTRIQFLPELYAIPWFLTLFTHVFPLDKIYRLWDKLLVGPPSLPLFVGISILQQMRDVLLHSEFNECIMIFSESFPEVDIERCIQTALSMCKVTPPSAMHRVHDDNSLSTENSKVNLEEKVVPDGGSQRWWDTPLPLEVKKTELAPRISLKDFVQLQKYALVIDIRGEQEFARGHLPDSYNLNPSQSLTTLTPLLKKLQRKYHVVLGKKVGAPEFAGKLVQAGMSRVCVLTGGIEAVRVEEVGISICACRPMKQTTPGLKGKGEPPFTLFRCRTSVTNLGR
ncbi:uncharacterized protein VTP21DRAFT_11542 [Calcarisporiella thermophila]|uniref:uncharacterized protein n=1 Tax=Calcarisporiella thermophila TaxID=911321 RepID=UPI00374450B4